MKRLLQFFLSSILATILMVSSAFALALGTNITIFDGVSTSQSQNWYGINEDQEVEPGCEIGQKWDLEGFFLNGSTLTMVGGFDFKNDIQGEKQSDLFIGKKGDVNYGSDLADEKLQNTSYQTIQNNFGYDFAIRFDFSDSNDLTYELYGLNDASTTMVYYGQNQGSNPLKYNDNGQTLTGGSFTYETGFSDSDVGFSGGTHNALSLDIAPILSLSDLNLENFMVHYTMYCGNDNLMGQGSAPVPEPASMMLFGTGLIGLAAFTRRKLNLKK